MPYVMLGFLAATDDNVDLSWRLCYVLPLAVQLGAVFVVLSGRDLPDGNFHELEMDGLKKRAISRIVIHVRRNPSHVRRRAELTPHTSSPSLPAIPHPPSGLERLRCFAACM
eukprot:3273763-Pleurochrysis_carterae.AAC.1